MSWSQGSALSWQKVCTRGYDKYMVACQQNRLEHNNFKLIKWQNSFNSCVCNPVLGLRSLLYFCSFSSPFSSILLPPSCYPEIDLSASPCKMSLFPKCIWGAMSEDDPQLHLFICHQTLLGRWSSRGDRNLRPSPRLHRNVKLFLTSLQHHSSLSPFLSPSVQLPAGPRRSQVITAPERSQMLDSNLPLPLAIPPSTQAQTSSETVTGTVKSLRHSYPMSHMINGGLI